MKTIENQGLYYELDADKQEATVIYDKSYHDNLTNVKIPDTITYENITYKVITIGDSAFDDCNRLTSVTIGNSIKFIGDSAFIYCNKLNNAKLKQNENNY